MIFQNSFHDSLSSLVSVFRKDRKEILAFTFISFLFYFLFSICYPKPYVTIDSSNYVWCAMQNEFGVYRPFGYSAFIRLVGFFSHSFSVLSFVQFFLFFFCSILFLYTIKQHFAPKKSWHFWALLFLALCSESMMYLNFWLMSDSLFISFSMLWLASIIWYFNTKNVLHLLFNCIVVFVLMKIRYSGLVCPIVSIIISLFLFEKGFWKVVVVNFLALVIIYFQGISDNKRVVDVETFSAFGGWIKANNASCLIPQSNIEATDINDIQIRRIHEVCKAFPDSFYSMENVSTTKFMWYKSYPGKIILMENFQTNSHHDSYIKCWAQLGVKLNEYSNLLIRENPFLFFRKFVLWNSYQFLFPQNDFNEFKDVALDDFTRQWFFIFERKASSTFDIYHKYFSNYNYAKYLFSWVLGLIALFGFYIFKTKSKLNSKQLKLLHILSIFIAISFLFLVLSHPIHLRYVIMYSTFFYTLFYMYFSTNVEEKNNH